jgi:hypothetical protein
MNDLLSAHEASVPYPLSAFLMTLSVLHKHFCGYTMS